MIRKTATLGIIILAIIIAGITMLFIITEGNLSGASTGIPQNCMTICK